ncbi:MAG TPA: FCD domain-containing protein [Trebonia sp.]|nr:FCD domain-containing protein [Trebonia sp.]
MNDQLIYALGSATRAACATIEQPGHHALQASVDLACAIPDGSGWECRAAAHAGFFAALADACQDSRATPVLHDGVELAYQLMVGAGRTADGIVINSRRRILASLRSGKAEDAAREMERHLRVLRFMGRLFGSGAAAVSPRA